MAIFDSATVHFVPAIADPGSWCFEVESDLVHCMSCTTLAEGQSQVLDAGIDPSHLTVPSVLADVPSCGDFGGYDLDVSVQATPGTYAYTDLKVDGLRIESTSNLQKLLPSLTYRAYLSDSLRYERRVEFTYQNTDNGCLGVQHVATVETPP
jgi:hypothetical protein